MYKTIVVPVDGSEPAARAVPIGSWLASRFGAELHLVTTTLASETSGAADSLRRAALHAGTVPVRTDVIRHSFPAAGVLDVAQTDDEALLCLSTRGTSGVHALLLGSVSDEVVRRCPLPLVLVGPACGLLAPTADRLLVCVDGSDTSEAVLPVVAGWALELAMEVDVVLVADAHRLAAFPTTTEAPVEHAEQVLRDAGVASTARVEVGATPSRVIVDLASSSGASLIAMATQGAGGLFTEALGHVATEVVRHAGVPVLVVPVHDRAN